MEQAAAISQHRARISFIGAGNMAGSLIGGLVAKGYPASCLRASDPNTAQLERLAKVSGIEVLDDNLAAIDGTDAIVLAIKPQVMQQVVAPLASRIQQQKPLIISIAAGITLANLTQWLGPDLAIIRSMPNTPALVQTGATGLFANTQVSEIQKQIANALFDAVGQSFWFAAEADLDKVVAISGSGPAYFFLVMEALEKAGVEIGLPLEMARALTLQTALGAAKLALSDDIDPTELRRRVTSPGGTTEQAIKQLQEGGLVPLFERAIKAARDRSIELGGGKREVS